MPHRVQVRRCPHADERALQTLVAAASTPLHTVSRRVPLCRYLLFLVARRFAGEWPNRGLYLLYGKLWMDVLRLSVLIMYFAVSGSCGSTDVCVGGGLLHHTLRPPPPTPHKLC